MVSWILLVAMSLSLPGGAMGHFVCTLGMVEAGPICPLCNGHASAEQPGPTAIVNSCCKFVVGPSTMVANLVPAKAEWPGLSLASLILPYADFGLLVAPDRDSIARVNQNEVRRTPASGYLSNFLRL